MSAPFKSSFDEATKQAGAAAGAVAGQGFVSEVQRAIDETVSRLEQLGSTNQAVDQVKGFVAEVHHAGTYNIDAARQSVGDVYAEVPASNLRGSPDVVVRHGDEVSNFQSKYYKTPGETAKALSDPVYRTDQKLGPSDQLDGIRDAAENRAARMPHRAEQAVELRDTAARTADRIDEHGAQSRPLSEPEAKQIAQEAKSGEVDRHKHGYTTGQVLEWTDVAREAGKAAVVGAIVTATLKTAPSAYRALRQWQQDGRVDEATLRELKRTAIAGAGSGALRGGLAGGLTIACRAGFLGEAAKGVSGGAIGAGTAVAIFVFVDGLALGRGEIDAPEFARRTTRNVVIGTAAYAGSAVGQTLIPIPILGAAIGGFLGSTVGAYGFEIGSEAFAVITREALWHEQKALVAGIADLARSTLVVAQETAIQVRVSADEEEALANAAAEWSDSADRARVHLDRARQTEVGTRDALDDLATKIARLKA